MSTATVHRPAETRRHKGRHRIDVREVRQVLEEIAASDPLHVDPRSRDGRQPRYIAQGEPNCLVALVLTRLGFTRGVIAALDQEFPTGEICAPGIRVAESNHPALRKITPAALRLLQYCQDAQDQGMRWGRIARVAFVRALVPTRRDRARRPWLYPQEH